MYWDVQCGMCSTGELYSPITLNAKIICLDYFIMFPLIFGHVKYAFLKVLQKRSRILTNSLIKIGLVQGVQFYLFFWLISMSIWKWNVDYKPESSKLFLMQQMNSDQKRMCHRTVYYFSDKVFSFFNTPRLVKYASNLVRHVDVGILSHANLNFCVKYQEAVQYVSIIQLSEMKKENKKNSRKRKRNFAKLDCHQPSSQWFSRLYSHIKILI